jgi:glycosyltransferase involved in cell wall biosynthesis
VYGGTELVVDQLARGLVRRGCDLVLFTTGDSTCPVQRRWLYPQALGTSASAVAERPHVELARYELDGADVIHDHTLTGPTDERLPRPAMPVVTTVHGPFTPDLRRLYASAAQRVSLIAISHDQRSHAPEIPVAAVIHHGIEVDRYPVGDGSGRYVLFLGRMHPDKGPHRAIAAARGAGQRILIAAKMREPSERRYFAECVEPLLGPDAVYLGEVGGQHKLDLLGGAEALLNPICWPEPFGLVMIEALACGTPVLSFAHGAAPEIVEHTRTGFLCRDEHEMAARLGDVASIDRAACRAAVEARFTTDRMVADHLALYRRLVRDGPVQQDRDGWTSGDLAESA